MQMEKVDRLGTARLHGDEGTRTRFDTPSGDAGGRLHLSSFIVPALSGLVALFWLLATAVFAQGLPEDSGAAVDEVLSIGMTVSDLDQAVDFYSRVLSFEKVSETEVAGEDHEHLQGLFGVRMRAAKMRLCSESIELAEYLAPEGRSIPEDWRSNDHWFQHIAIVVSDIDRAYQHLRKFRVRHASSGPQRLPDWNPNAGGISAFYFKDPDGHVLEVIHFPEGKGDPRWQDIKGDALFLGIDHTAIVVADTEESLRFYRDTLGLRIAGESENYGTEQEHLNNVFGARLRITALRVARGPGVELLEYMAPSDGRPAPRDTRACDLWHWQIRMSAPSLEVVHSTLREKMRAGECSASFRSNGVVRMSTPDPGFALGLTLSDPDGHEVQVSERGGSVGSR